MHDDDVIEGELAESSSSQEIVKQDEPHQVAVFNPLDAEPVAFARQLATRQDNYDQLKYHLIGVLVPGKDFGRIHHANKDKCPQPWHCSYEREPGHWTDYTLFSPGGDKILGILGLGVHYPDLKDYKRAVLKGLEIQEVIADAQIIGHNDQVIATGCGACARSEINNRSLNNTIKRACKRARLDAVNRLPVISALFEDDFLARVAERAKDNKNNTAASRVQKVNKRWDTGATLEVCPIGNEIKGKPWRELETGALEWIVENVTDKPDIHRAAARELSKRSSAAEPGSIRTSSSPDSERSAT